jgi:ribosomal protein S18 acetylase RimI-like enzyme
MNIRKAEKKDYSEICDLFTELDSLHVNLDPETFKPFEGPPRPFEIFNSFLTDENKTFIVATIEKKIVGFINGHIMKSSQNPMFVPIEYFYVDNVVVSSNHQNKGIGKILVKEGIKWAKDKNVNKTRLTVYNKNKKAMDFYYHLGFEDISRTMEIS